MRGQGKVPIIAKNKNTGITHDCMQDHGTAQKPNKPSRSPLFMIMGQSLMNLLDYICNMRSIVSDCKNII